MSPLTLHYVITPKKCITQGTHHFSVYTMDYSVAGVVKDLLGAGWMTNAYHPEANMLIRRMGKYFNSSLTRIDMSAYSGGSVFYFH